MNDRPFLRQIRLRRDEVPSFADYPFSAPALQSLDTVRFHPDVTFFVGENGSGKSTLLEAIAVALRFNPEGGNKKLHFPHPPTPNSNCHLGMIAVMRGYFLRAESFYNLATRMEETGYQAHSYRNASIGFIFAALRAGMIPKTIPISIAKISAIIVTVGSMMRAIFIPSATATVIPSPRTTPTTPPSPESTTASIRN